jgi:acyl-CoA thioester hydrolase
MTESITNPVALPSDGLVITRLEVLPAWLDYNGHMNVAYYIAAFDLAIEDLKAAYGLDAAYREAHQRSTVALESHITYQQEAHLGEALRIESRILGTDGRRLHVAQAMYRDTTLLATQEALSVSFDLDTRRTCFFDPPLKARIDMLQAAQAVTGTPSWVGRRIGLDTRRP